MEAQGGASGRRSWRQRLVIGLGATLATLMLVGAAVVGFGWSKVNSFERIEDLELNAKEEGVPLNYLLVGSDSRANVAADDANADAFLDGEATGKRSDTIIIARVDPGASTVSLLSIPRDLYVPIAGTDVLDRVNGAYNEGPQALLDTVTGYLGIEINHYIEVDFAGFKGLVEVLGGVPVYIDTPLRDPRSGLNVPEAACVTLSGDDALAFARSRSLEFYDAEAGRWKTDPTGDLGRISRQQLFLQRAADKAATLGLTDVVTLNRLIDVAADNVAFDEGLDIGDTVGLARQFASLGGEAVVTYSLPTVPFVTVEGAQVLQMLNEEAQPILDVFRGLAPRVVAPLQPGEITIDVLNGTGISGQASDAARRLEGYGFVLGTVGDAAEGDQPEQTVLRHPVGDRPSAELVASVLRSTATFEESADVAVVTLITGADFTGVNLAEAVPLTQLTSPSQGTSPTTPDGQVSSGGVQPPAVSTTTTAPVGFVPKDPPPGVTCG